MNIVTLDSARKALKPRCPLLTAMLNDGIVVEPDHMTRMFDEAVRLAFPDEDDAARVGETY